MNRLLVFLHGKGANKSAHGELVNEIARQKKADILCFDAPYKNLKHPNGFQWFDKVEVSGTMQMNVRQFNHSADYIIKNIEDELEKRGQTWSDVILLGHSQGGLMSCYLALINSPSEVISLCGDFPDYLSFECDIDKTVPIYWIEAGKDDYLSKERRETYKILLNWGCNLKYFISPDSTHNHLELDILKRIGD